MTTPRFSFWGSPAFAVPILSALIAGEWTPSVVITKPDRPAGRGLQLRPTDVASFASRAALPVLKPVRLDERFARDLHQRAPDFAVVAAYGTLIPSRLLRIVSGGFLNIHPSLLPRWRGPTPIQSAIASGDTETGVSLMLLDDGMDTGPLLAQARLSISRHETAGTLHDKLATLAATLLVNELPAFTLGKLVPRPQPATGVTISSLIDELALAIDWRRTTEEIGRFVRAYQPAPGCFTHWHTLLLKVLSVRRVPCDPQPAGTVIATATGDVAVAASDGALVLESIQPSGRRAMSGRQFAHGHRDFIGSRLQ